MLFVLRLLFGVSAAPVYPGAGHAIALATPERLRGRANSAVLASIGVGNAVAAPLLGTISLRSGWRAAMLAAAAITGAGTIVWWFLAPGESIRHVAGRPAGFVPSTSKAPPPLVKRSFWFLCASYFLESYLGYVFVFWLYLYLIQARNFSQLHASWITSLPWLLTLVGIPLGGTLSDWASIRLGDTWGRRAVPMVALLVSAVLFIVTGRTASPYVAAAAFTLCTPITLACEPPFWATMNHLSGAHSGIGGGVLNFFGNLGGVLSPQLMPWLAARWGWTAALSWTAVLAVAASLLWFGVDLDANP
jgi:ACS family glucarate transporter-like MFS transporter